MGYIQHFRQKYNKRFWYGSFSQLLGFTRRISCLGLSYYCGIIHLTLSFGEYCVIFTYNRQHFLVDWVLRLEEKPGNSSYITFLLVHQANKEKKYGMTRKENTWIFKALGRNIFKKILRIYLKLMFPRRKTYDSIVCYTTSAHCNIINTITLLSKNERQ